MRGGEALEIGDVRLQFLETPGHTPESVSILVFDLAADAATPRAVLTGDTLFIGDVGRPDLMASVGVTAEELAGKLYDSLHEKLLPLPDETLVYPAHGAGSMCGKNLSSETFSTMGQQRETNYALQPMEREAFVSLITAGQPETPAYFAHDAELNRSEHRTLDAVLAETLRPLALEEVLRLQNAGAVVLDTRDADAFAAGHLRGSINVGLDGRYATWVGTLIDKDTSIVLLAEADHEGEATTRLGRIGFDRVVGHLDADGRTALETRPGLCAGHERLKRQGLAGQLDAAEPPLVVDVRTPNEWEGGHIAGDLHVPLNRLPKSLDRIPRDRALVCICKSGYRSSSAASLLEAAGYERVTDLAGGMDAWEGNPSEPEVCGA